MPAKILKATELKSPRKPDQHDDASVKVISDKASTARSEAAQKGKGHDERGRYGKSAPDPETHDSYADKRS